MASQASRIVNKLFVGNIPWTVGHRELVEYFSQFGPVNVAKVVFDRSSGLSRGYGFVEFSARNGYDNATNKGSQRTPNNISDESPSILEYSDYVVQEAANLGLMCVPMAIFDQHYAALNPINANISQEEYPISPLDRSYRMLPDISNIADETYTLQGGSPLASSSPLDRAYRRLPDTSNISQEECSLVGGSPLGMSPHDRGYRTLPNTSNISQEDYPLVGGSPMGAANCTYSIPRDRTYNIPRNRTYSIPRDRTYSIPRDRTYNIPPDRTYSIPRDRTYSVARSSRGGSQNISREEFSLMGGSPLGSPGNQCSPSQNSPMFGNHPPIRSIAHLSVVRQINFDTPAP